jgi:hypothetical protein
VEGDVLGGLAGRRAAIAAARSALAGLGEDLFEAVGSELGPVLGEVDALVAAGELARVAVTAEAVGRGETGGASGTTPTGWVLAWAPALRAGGAGLTVGLARDFAKAANAPVRAATEAGRIPVRSAAVVIAEAERLRPRLADGAEGPVLEGLIAMAEQDGPRGCRRLRPALLARHGLDGELQADHDAVRRHLVLDRPLADGLGLYEYRLVLDPEGMAALEAAVGPLSAPRPVDGEPDLRPSQQRRAEALVEVVRRAVAAGEGVPSTAKAQLFVTVDHEVLANGLRGAGATVGGPDAGTLLAPQTVRRLACDAALIPVVLGGAGEVLDWGRQKRLFTPAQVKRLWLRDGGCSYPGCSIPAHWADAHHLVHWADGGPTDLTNAALLCGHHHRLVHTRRLAGTVTDGAVHWDRRRGSYDAVLAERSARRRP